MSAVSPPSSDLEGQKPGSTSESDGNTGWMVDVIDEVFAVDLRQGLEETVFPHALAVQRLTKVHCFLI